ncbi:MAG: bifunctional hydroxymethylpyrimidine kinase/phosphomethylpyrimidine kinase [Pseudomonadota bacterium]
MQPIALTIAGSDSGGGAGIQADLKTFSALGVFGTSAITAITAQNTLGVNGVDGISPAMIAAQIDAVFDDLSVGAVKIGMLGTPDVIDAVVGALARHSAPIVLDPVMVAKSGDPLLPDDAVDALKERLVPVADVVTPNLPEAARLLGTNPAGSEQEMKEQGAGILALGPNSVLMKGGHAHGETCVDLLMTQDRAPLRLSANRFQTRNTHGTGCTLSAAIAAGLARGLPLEAAVTEAHAYLQKAIRAADQLNVGHGHGPVHHFHELWREYA